MATIQDQIVTRLTADAAFASAVPGGVWKRELKREGPGATPDAFAPTPPYQVRPTCVLPDAGEVGHPQGITGTFLAFPTLWFYAPAHENGKAAIRAAMDLARGILHRWTFATASGMSARIEVIPERLGVRDSDEMAGAVVDYERFKLISAWRNLD